ncbi:MAG: glycosyltransferase family 2 protein [Bacteroidetes bacterium]|nr:glycosyltransferase family 2 protein [Bacteroidota bacterium]
MIPEKPNLLSWVSSLFKRRVQGSFTKDSFIDVQEKMEQIIKTMHVNLPTKLIIVTPTTGDQHLYQAIESVQSQSYENLLQYIIVDGAEYESKVEDIAKNFNAEKLRIVTLPYNTGKNGINGHRIYASMPLLLNSEYVMFLDEDNWWDADHVKSLVELIERDNLDWAFSMRKIYTQGGVFVTNDNCENIGPYPSFSQWSNLVDTNCYAFKRSTIVQTAHYWYHPLRADRFFYKHLAEAFPNYKSTGKYTVNYRLNESRPPSPDYFLRGNQYMMDKYNYKLPWVS